MFLVCFYCVLGMFLVCLMCFQCVFGVFFVKRVLNMFLVCFYCVFGMCFSVFNVFSVCFWCVFRKNALFRAQREENVFSVIVCFQYVFSVFSVCF